jgi:hypothetical protein
MPAQNSAAATPVRFEEFIGLSQFAARWISRTTNPR